mmetsp:Transcript_9585/g.25556  ORF Transcript_9585/g.25556 Transcript_9585/m.25556 type:complete len:233 (+) Transcript_9585:127-825(+)
MPRAPSRTPPRPCRRIRSTSRTSRALAARRPRTSRCASSSAPRRSRPSRRRSRSSPAAQSPATPRSTCRRWCRRARPSHSCVHPPRSRSSVPPTSSWHRASAWTAACSRPSRCVWPKTPSPRSRKLSRTSSSASWRRPTRRRSTRAGVIPSFPRTSTRARRKRTPSRRCEPRSTSSPPPSPSSRRMSPSFPKRLPSSTRPSPRPLRFVKTKRPRTRRPFRTPWRLSLQWRRL